MATKFGERLERAAFARVEFQCTNIQIHGGIRLEKHEAAKVPGANIEKFGRKAYEISMDCIFALDVPLYPNAWPDNLTYLRGLWEAETTDDLVIPTIGTIKACAEDWDQANTNKFGNGETVRVKFVEDQESDTLIDSVLAFSYQSIGVKADVVILEADALGVGDFFAALKSLASQVQGLKDQIQLQQDLLANKIQDLVDACNTLDETLDFLDDPVSYKLVAALHDLGVAAGNLQQDMLKKLSPTTLFTVPSLMTVQQLAGAIYGDTTRALELMQMNPFNDALAIPPGFKAVCYSKAA